MIKIATGMDQGVCQLGVPEDHIVVRQTLEQMLMRGCYRCGSSWRTKLRMVCAGTRATLKFACVLRPRGEKAVTSLTLKTRDGKCPT